jgi:hypothetical protein
MTTTALATETALTTLLATAAVIPAFTTAFVDGK